MRIRGPAIILAIVSLICTQIPLLNYLGYEFSTLIALVSSFIAGSVTIRSVTRSTKRERAAFSESLQRNLTLLTIPLVVMTTNALFVRNCSLLEGFGFFLLLPVVSVVFGCALGFLCAVHYCRARAMFILFFIITLAYALSLGYFTPAVYSYNFFYGYFPGFTYDEVLGIRLPLVWFRLFTLFVAGVLVWLAQLVVRHVRSDALTLEKGLALLKLLARPPQRTPAIIVATVFVAVFFFRCELGFEATDGFIQSQLGGRFESNAFTIYYPLESFTEDEIRWVAAEHEFRLHQVAEAFFLPISRTIESYIYPSAAEKFRLIGAGQTNIAKPWRRQIHLTRQSLEGSLKHELVHVVTAPFGVPVVDVSLSTGLVEGVAMAVEWNWGNPTLHQYAAAMRRFGVAPDITGLMGFAGFARQASSVSYVLAGSFCRFLIDRYGMRAMTQVYRTLEYQQVYGRPLGALADEWGKFLDSLVVEESDRDAVDVLFRRPPIFEKVCARVVAERNARARALYTSRDYATAADLYRQSYNETRGYEAFSGFLASSLRLGNYEVLAAALDTVIMASDRPAQYLPLFIMIGDAFWMRGESQRAAELYDRVRIADISDALIEGAILRNVCVADTSLSALRRYFLSDLTDTARIALLDSLAQAVHHHWIIPYLKGRVVTRMQRYDEAPALLERTSTGVPFLEAQRLKTMGAALFRLERFQAAKAQFWLSLNHHATEVAVLEVQDWVQRCEWIEERGLP